MPYFNLLFLFTTRCLKSLMNGRKVLTYLPLTNAQQSRYLFYFFYTKPLKVKQFFSVSKCVFISKHVFVVLAGITTTRIITNTCLCGYTLYTRRIPQTGLRIQLNLKDVRVILAIQILLCVCICSDMCTRDRC